MPVRVKIKVTIPDQILDAEIVRRSIAKKLRTVSGPKIKRLFQGTVYGWKNKPQFPQKITNTSRKLSVAVWAAGEYAMQYSLVAKGSPPHRIPSSGATFMRFRPGYRASTSPGSLMSRRNYRSGAFITRFVVNHPGFTAREFDVLIANEYGPVFPDDVHDAIKEAIALQPHSSHTY